MGLRRLAKSFLSGRTSDGTRANRETDTLSGEGATRFPCSLRETDAGIERRTDNRIRQKKVSLWHENS